MYKDVQITDYIDIVHQRLSKGGVFLTAKSNSETNTMTIGWGGITYFWNKPIFIVPVRASRHTYKFIDNADEFTVSVPIDVDLKKALLFCGSRSGRDVNKYEESGLITFPGRVIETPIIKQCELHYECKIVYRQPMDPSLLCQDIEERFYPDYHTMYYGEIVSNYLIRN